MTGSEDRKPEPNRARVRRLLLDPLGFRFPHKSQYATDPARAQKFLNRICDDLAYLDDAELRHMVEMLQGKGEGARRDFWPGFACFRGHAESIRPRPIEDLPEMRGWFGSVEGPRARAEGTLVETYEFMLKAKHPPYLPKHREAIQNQARENRRRLSVIARRKADGVFAPDRSAIDRDDQAFEHYYTARRAFVDELIVIINEKRGAEA